MSSTKPLQQQNQQQNRQGSTPGAGLAPDRPAAGSPTRLKAERVQLEAERGQLQAEPARPAAGSFQDRLKAERVQEALRTMTGWRLAAGGYAIDRVRRFPDPASAAAFAGFLVQAATHLGQPIGIELAGEHVAITLPGRLDQGRRPPLNEAVLDFARTLG